MKCQQRQESSMCPGAKLPRVQFLFLLFLTLWPGVRCLTSLWTDCCICKMENNKCYFEVYFLSLRAILWNSTFKWVYLSFSPLSFTSLLFSAICKASSDSHFAFLHFFFFEMVLITVSCTMSQTSIHSSSGTLSIRSNPVNLLVTSTV